MSKRLLSVGLDVGTTTTQMIVSELTVENKASSFAVPEMQITERNIRYKGPVHFTPLTDESHVDGQAIRRIVEQEYANAGIQRRQVDTGAVIITGETSRKENARTVLDALSEYAGDFVVATAGPDLESVLAARGAGAVEYSAQTGKTVLHMDIGGGTSNLAYIREGKIQRTGCLNVGGRLLKFHPGGKLFYVSPVLRGLTDLQPGDYPAPGQVEAIAQILTHALEMAAGLREKTALLDNLWTAEGGPAWTAHEEDLVISFSGGVADCIEREKEPLAYGDMGPALGQAIRNSFLCRGQYRLGSQTIRATVIGAGCHSAQLSGSTVFCKNITLPVKNLPVVSFTEQEQESAALSGLIADRLQRIDGGRAVLTMPGLSAPTYGQVNDLAKSIAAGVKNMPVMVCLEADMAKALGHSLCLQLPEDTPCLCIDRVRLGDDSFLDVGSFVGPCLPVVVKTLVLSGQ